MTDNATPPADNADTGGASGTPPAAPPGGGEPPKSTESASDSPPPASTSSEGTADSTTFKLPDEYKDKPWASKIKSESDLWKQVENLQALAGKKTIIPDLSKATPEEREAYYAALRPKSVDEYGLAQLTDDFMLPGVKAALADGMLKEGISPVQAKPILEKLAAASQEAQLAAFDPKNFAAEAEKVEGLGKGYEPKVVQNALKSVLSPDAYAGIMENIPNANLVQIHRAMKEIIDAYGIKESGSHVEAPLGTQKTVDPEARSKELFNEIVALSKRPHTQEEKQKLIDERNAIFQQRARAQGA